MDDSKYRDLLIKYIRYVSEVEGVDYLEFRETWVDVCWTDEEWAELQRLRE